MKPRTHVVMALALLLMLVAPAAPAAAQDDDPGEDTNVEHRWRVLWYEREGDHTYLVDVPLLYRYWSDDRVPVESEVWKLLGVARHRQGPAGDRVDARLVAPLLWARIHAESEGRTVDLDWNPLVTRTHVTAEDGAIRDSRSTAVPLLLSHSSVDSIIREDGTFKRETWRVPLLCRGLRITGEGDADDRLHNIAHLAVRDSREWLAALSASREWGEDYRADLLQVADLSLLRFEAWTDGFPGRGWEARRLMLDDWNAGAGPLPAPGTEPEWRRWSILGGVSSAYGPNDRHVMDLLPLFRHDHDADSYAWTLPLLMARSSDDGLDVHPRHLVENAWPLVWLDDARDQWNVLGTLAQIENVTDPARERCRLYMPLLLDWDDRVFADETEIRLLHGLLARSMESPERIACDLGPLGLLSRYRADERSDEFVWSGLWGLAGMCRRDTVEVEHEGATEEVGRFSHTALAGLLWSVESRDDGRYASSIGTPLLSHYQRHEGEGARFSLGAGLLLDCRDRGDSGGETSILTRLGLWLGHGERRGMTLLGTGWVEDEKGAGPSLLGWRFGRN